MLIRENELRTCDETQTLYAVAEQEWDTDWMEVTEKLQKRVLTEFGVEDEELGLKALRCAWQLYPDDSDFKEIPLYIKYNRARKTSFCVGDDAPNTDVVCMNGSKDKLLNYIRGDVPLVIVAGSYS